MSAKSFVVVLSFPACVSCALSVCINTKCWTVNRFTCRYFKPEL